MGSQLASVVPFILLLILRYSAAYPLCLNQERPFKSSKPLTFCNAKYSDYGCCTPERDAILRTEFSSRDNKSVACAAFEKATLCAECDPWAADLFGATDGGRSNALSPFLCGSENASAPSGYCSQMLEACANDTSVLSPTVSTGTSAALYSYEFSTERFCADNAPTSDSKFCFSGEPFVPPAAPPRSNMPAGICFERISNETYIEFVPHTDGKRAFVTTQPGVIFLADIPPLGGKLVVRKTPFLDLTSRVSFTEGTELGLLGLVLHPQFAENGRFFVSYSCDSTVHADCKARCGCYAAGNCSEAVMRGAATGGFAGVGACRNSSVVAEYSALDAQGNLADVANKTEVRRVFTMGHPFANHNGGDLHFSAANGYLYFTMGDGGGGNDLLGAARNKLSPLGKILRLDVDGKPGSKPSSSFNISWGNYFVPADNPFVNDSSALPEIFALGLRNPWRCSFDMARPSYFLCGDVGQSKTEEVDLIVKGADYGWGLFEGTVPLHAKPNTSYPGLTPPIIEYNRSVLPSNSASVIGGYFFRSMTTDPCLYGLYVFNDWKDPFFVAQENPPYSGSFNFSQIPRKCANISAISCPDEAEGGQMFWSWGEDLLGDLYAVGSHGVFRIISPDQCGFPTCKAEAAGAPPPSTVLDTPSPSPPPAKSAAAGERSPGFYGRKMALTTIVCAGCIVNYFLGPQFGAVVACLLAIKFAPSLLPPRH